MLARQEKFQEAYDSCARSAEIEPRAQTCANMAMALTNLHGLRNPGAERRRRATDPADRAIGTGEGYAYAHFVKAHPLLAAGREPEAGERIARAVSLDPGFARDSTGEHLGARPSPAPARARRSRPRGRASRRGDRPARRWTP